MAEAKAKGSIIYEILIVILAAVLVGSILYPKKLTEQEERNIELSRYRMDQIQKAALQYQKYSGVYTDTLSKIFEFIRTSPEYSHYVDSVIVGGIDSIITRLNDFKAKEEIILSSIPSAIDTVMIDSLSEMQTDIKLQSRQLAGYVEYVHDKLQNLPNMPIAQLKEAFLIVDSKQFTLDMDIVKNSIQSGQLQEAEKAARDVINVIEGVRDQFQLVLDKLPEYKSDSLDSLAFCPTTHKPYRLVHIDTSTIKYLNIYSPIDSTDIQIVQSSFLKSKIGGLKLKNHGKIESGEKSWEVEGQ